LLDEIRLAGPKVVGLDILMGEPQEVRVSNGGGSSSEIHDDAEMAAALGRLKCGVVATSFTLSPEETDSPVNAAAIEQMSQNLEMTSEQFSSAIASRGLHATGGMSDSDLYVISRRQAMRDRISVELKGADVTRDQAIAKLLPHSDPANHSPLLRVFDQEWNEVTAVRRLANFQQCCAEPNSIIRAVRPSSVSAVWCFVRIENAGG
jgi:hypothetical protein